MITIIRPYNDTIKALKEKFKGNNAFIVINGGINLIHHAQQQE